VRFPQKKGVRRISKTYPEMDAVIIFHHEWEALNEAAQSFRKNYDKGELLIARDTLPVERKATLDSLGAKYLPTFSTTQFFIDLKFANRELNLISQVEFLGKINQDINRMDQVVYNSQSEYILFMEADSLVRGRVAINENYDMDTLIANPYPPNLLNLVEEVSGRKLPVNGWGFVTGYVKRSSLESSLRWAENNSETLIKIFECDPRFTYLDHFLPILFHIAGFRIFNSGQVGECLRDKRWERKKYTLLHQYRINY